MTRGFLGSCGKAVHGKEAPGGGLPLCFACGRPSSRDGCSSKWKHVGRGAYWAELGEWCATVGEEWPHKRALQGDPLQVGGCICCRPNCVDGIYRAFRRRREKEENGSRDNMVVGQPSPTGRYPSTGFQVRALLEHGDVEGSVLDCCGAGQDAVSTVLTAHGLRVATNDLNPGLVADTHLDATTDAFAEAYLDDTRRPDWVVTSPPNKFSS